MFAVAAQENQKSDAVVLGTRDGLATETARVSFGRKELIQTICGPAAWETTQTSARVNHSISFAEETTARTAPRSVIFRNN